MTAIEKKVEEIKNQKKEKDRRNVGINIIIEIENYIIKQKINRKYIPLAGRTVWHFVNEIGFYFLHVK